MPDLPELRPDRIDAWILDLRHPESSSLSDPGQLPEAEEEYARRFHFEQDRRRFVACRAALRRLLGAYTLRPPTRVELRFRDHGKPELPEGDNPLGVHFNVAHSGDLGLICVTVGQEIGCDVERVQPDFDVLQVARIVFTPREVAELRCLDPPARARAFFLAWTRKESFVKALGTGMSHPLQTFEVSPADERSPLPIRFLELSPPAPWRAGHDEPRPGYIAAVAWSSPARVRWRELDGRDDGRRAGVSERAGLGLQRLL